MTVRDNSAIFPILFACLSVGQSACLTPPPEGAPGAASPGASTANTTLPGAGSSAAASGSVAYNWKNVTILGGGFVTGNVFSVAERGLIYARTDVGGAYRFSSHDKAWVPLTDQFSRADSNYVGVESIAPDPSDANVVYAAVGTSTASWAGHGAMIRSHDRGATWQVTPLAIKMGSNDYGRSNGERLVVDPNDGQVLFFGSRRDGLWKSSDGSLTWAKVDAFPVKTDSNGFGIPFVVFDKQSGSKGKATPGLYAGASSSDVGLYRSMDGGASWKAVAGQPKGVMPSHADFDSTGALFLSYANGVGPGELTTGGIWKYEPKKEAWTDITPVAPNDADKFGYGAVAVDAQHPGSLLAATLDRWTKGDEIFRTNDGGKHWTPLMPTAERDVAGAAYLTWHRPGKVGPPGWDGDIDIDPFDGSHALHVTGQGTWASNDVTAADGGKPTHWTFFDRGLEETVVATLVSPPVGPPLLSGVGDICGFRHDALDEPPTRGMFENPLCGGTSSIDFAELQPTLFARVGNGGDDKHKRGAFSTDSGATWTEFASEPPKSNGSGSIGVSADGKVLVWAARDATPAFSLDHGATWTTSQGAPEPTKVPDWAPVNLRVASDRVNPKKFYIFDEKEGTVFTSADGGAHFAATVRGLPGLPEYQLTSGSAHAVPGVEGDVWLSTGKELYHSTDSGKNFAPIVVQESHSIGFGKAAPGKTYPALYLIGKVSDVSGFFRSDDAGSTWQRINDDAHQFGFAAPIIGDPRIYGRVYVGTGGRGILYADPR
ncbi:MAG TPA: sialidase family protein [Polyangiaceae bacterium]|jgi:photosystem II stability/assembly factor-like uncharacterized protein|nr:sialidase family protein [Polyangiaceae bacterium]